MYCAQTEVKPSATCGTCTTSASRCGIAPRDPVARRDLVGEDLELLDQHGRLDGVEAAVGADAHVVVAVTSLAVHAHAAHDRGERVVVGEHRAAVAVAAERLGRKEAGRGRERRACRCCGCDRSAPKLWAASSSTNRFSASAIAAIARWSAGCPNMSTGMIAFGLESRLARGDDGLPAAFRIEIEARLVDIGEDRRRADQRHHLGGRGRR